MRILEVGKYYPPRRGGMETLLQQICQGLVAHGHEVRALVSGIDRAGSEDGDEAVEVRRLGRWGELASVPVCPGMFGTLRRELRDFDPDIVHLHLPHPLAVTAWLVAGDDRPVVVSYHSDIVRQKNLLWLWAPWRDRLLARAAAIHVTSPALIRSSRVLGRFREKCSAIAPGVDPAKWQRPAEMEVEVWEERIGPGAFLFVGRLVYYKGLEVLLEAIRRTDLRIAICGDGPLRKRLQQLAAGHGRRVVFLGDVDAGVMPALFAAARGLVLPSVAESETFGVVQLEAMAAGLPLVVSRASAGVESVHEGEASALLVPPRDPMALRDAMLRLRDEPALAVELAAAGHRRIESSYLLSERMEEMSDWLCRFARGRSTTA